jgi:tol-pal system protein YbgF
MGGVLLSRHPAVLSILALATVCAGLSAGCEDRTAILSRQLEDLKRDLAQMKAGSANVSVQMEDLQNKILLLQDQVESHQILLSRTPGPAPSLPVVKLVRGERKWEEQPKPRETEGPSLADAEPQEGPVVHRKVDPSSIPEVRFQQLDDSGLVVDMGSGQPVSGVIEGSAPSGDGGRVSLGTGRKDPPPTPRKSFDSRPVELYKYGFELLEQKRHDEAIAQFERFLEQYPNHDYADNALYWMGEAYYDIQSFRKAFDCFEKVVTLYPSGNKVPDSMLKSGLCLANLGDHAAAGEVMRQLVAHYPATRAADIAQEKLAGLRQEKVPQ